MVPRGRIVIDSLVRHFGARRVLDGVSESLGRGEVLGLLGPNGAGKTTTLRIVMGFERADAGDVRLGERSILTLPVERRRGLGIGYLPQEPSVFTGMTARENILVLLEALGLDRGAAGRAMERMEISHLADQKAGSLSGGERRRLEMARMLALDPDFWLLDEPFTGLDPRSMDGISGIVRALRDEGKGILVSDHNVRETVDLCDRVALLDAGRVIVSGEPEHVIDHPLARQRYLGDGFGT